MFNGLALQLLWGMLETFSCLHRDLASDMKQLFQGFAQQVHTVILLLAHPSATVHLDLAFDFEKFSLDSFNIESHVTAAQEVRLSRTFPYMLTI